MFYLGVTAEAFPWNLLVTRLLRFPQPSEARTGNFHLLSSSPDPHVIREPNVNLRVCKQFARLFRR